MQIRTFRVPFARVVGTEATELEFGPDDYLVVRPIFGLSKAELEGWVTRFGLVTDAAGEDPERAKALSDDLVIDLLGVTCLEWHLTGPDGKAIEKPGTAAALYALPGAIAGNLFEFLTTYRGESPNPTTRS